MSDLQYPDPRRDVAPVPTTPAVPVFRQGGPTLAPRPVISVHGGAPSRVAGKTRHPWGVWLLSIVTLGIYTLIWYFKINKELRDFDPSIDVQPGLSVLAVTFGGLLLGIPLIVSYCHTTGRIQRAQKLSGSQARCSLLLAWLCGFLSFGIVYVQSQLDKVWDQYGNPPVRTPIAA